ncbi:MAG: GntR family transcriptional regulator [Pseudomonadota bacterium]
MPSPSSPQLSVVVSGTRKGASLNDQAYALLKNEILLCRLAPGAEISEGLLVQRFGLGKAPIRHALGRLRQEKFVLTRGRLGNIVAPITLQDVREVFQLRLLLEIEATRLAAGRVDAETLRTLEAQVEACHAAGNATTDDAYREANYALHTYIARAGGNERLAGMVAALIEQHERIIHFSLRVQNRPAEFHHVHDNLVEALIAGDGARASQIAEATIRASQTRIIEAFVAETPARPD